MATRGGRRARLLVLAWLCVSALIAGTLVGAGCAKKPQATAVTMRIGMVTVNDVQQFAAEQFKALVEERSKGSITVEVYPGGQLGSNDQMLQNLQNGSLQGLLEPTSFLAGFDPVLQVLDLPAIFPDGVKSAVSLLNGQVGDPLRARLESKGFELLRFYQYGSNICITKFDPSKLESFKGKKIRVMPSQVLIGRMNAFGAVGTPMSVPELYTALQQGTIDGIEGAEAFISTQKYYEIAKYLWLAPNAPNITFFMVNKAWLEGLPKEQRDIIKQAAVDLDATVNGKAEELAESAIDTMKAAGVTVVEPSAEVKAKLQQLWAPLSQTFLSQNPDAKPIYDAITAVTGGK